MDWRNLSSALATVIVLAVGGVQPAAGDEPVETHPGISLEPMYSEAVIAYNAKQPVEALKVLDALLKIKADYSQALELKALVLKGMGNQIEAHKNYEALLKITPDTIKAAPYHFELGVIDFNAKRLETAVDHFQKAVAGNFNTDAAHFFSGLIRFTQSEKSGKLGDAEAEFAAVNQGTTQELKAASHYYLGLIAYKRGQGSDGTHELFDARAIAREMPDNAIAKDIDKAVTAALAPYSKGQLFGNFSVMGGFNNNVSSLPVTAVSSPEGSGQSTAQILGTVGIGWMSSPLSFIQWVASYRGSGNYNFNGLANSFEFLSHTADIYLTRNPLGRTQYGLKLEGTWTFNDATNSDTGANALTPFSLGGEIGPYLRQEVAKGEMLTLEAYYRPQHFSQSSNSDVSGQDGVLRATLQVDRQAVWWNPIWTLGIERNRTDGDTFRDWALDLGLSDQIHFNERNVITVTLGVNLYAYLESDPERFDKLASARLDWIHQLSSHWTTIADVGYNDNFSNKPDTYHYTQLSLSGGVGYSF